MKRFSKLIGFIVVFIAVMAAFCTVSFAAILEQGTALPAPESGWIRVSVQDPNWTWEGDWTNHGKGATYSNSAFQKINFTGDKIRLLDVTDSWSALKHIVYIDGIKYTAVEPQINSMINVVLDLQDLENKEHTLVITTELGDSNHHSGIGYIDIAENATVKPFNPNIADYDITLEVASIDNGKVNLIWNTVEEATNYIVKRSTTPSGPYETVGTLATNTFTDTTITNGTTYYYVVSAVVNGTESQNSNEVSATIPQPANQLKLVLEVNEEKQLSVSDELSDNADMEWISSDLTIATVDANGKIKTLKSGNAVITCTSDEYTESINVLVVDLDYQLAVSLSVGDTCRLTVDDLANTANVTWFSYDPTIATVSSKGKVTAINEGLTYIVVKNEDGNEIGRIFIRVRQ